MGMKNSKQGAFTIIELLIVIVVIGILAAISFVSYNGVQDRARDVNVKSVAAQVRTKIEFFNTVLGMYPTAEFIVDYGMEHDSVPEARIGEDVRGMLTYGEIATSHETGRPIKVQPCGIYSNPTGYIVQYYQSGPLENNGEMVIGTGC